VRTAKSTDQNVFILSVSILMKVYCDLVPCSCNVYMYVCVVEFNVPLNKV